MMRIAATFVPLSRSMKEQINHIRDWASERLEGVRPSRAGDWLITSLTDHTFADRIEDQFGAAVQV